MSERRLQPDTAEARAALLAETIRHVACLEGEITATALTNHLLRWSGLNEEEIGGDVMTTLFLLMRSGLFETNTCDPAEGSFSLAHNTVLIPSRTLITYIHAGMSPEVEEGEGAA